MTRREFLRAEVRQLTANCLPGGRAAPGHFRELVSLLLSNTVLVPSSSVYLIQGPGGPDVFMLGGGRDPREPLQLKNDRFLRLAMTMYLDPQTTDRWLKVRLATFQYQLDVAGDQWVFRYDYLRDPLNRYPPAHLQLRGELWAEAALPVGMSLQEVHFPTGRVTIEAVIRLLVETFAVPCDDWAEVWRPALAESEQMFLRAAHHPLSGPDD